MAFFATNTVAAAASSTSGGHLRGPSVVELGDSPLKGRQLTPENVNGTAITNSITTMYDCDYTLNGQTCTEEGSRCVVYISACCDVELNLYCTCKSAGDDTSLLSYVCEEGTSPCRPCQEEAN